MKIGAIILAAGLSSRMGQFKPLEQIGERSLLGHCFQLFHDCGIRRITVVTGHRGEEISQACKGLKTKTVANSNYLTGMFSSIQCGVKQIGRAHV
jgi:CTP:molybdopterin cytidylyltransferase MocA